MPAFRHDRRCLGDNPSRNLSSVLTFRRLEIDPSEGSNGHDLAREIQLVRTVPEVGMGSLMVWEAPWQRSIMPYSMFRWVLGNKLPPGWRVETILGSLKSKLPP